MKLGRSIFRHTAIYSAATLFGKLVGFFMLPFYAHIFQTEGYGVIAMIDASLGLLMIPLSGSYQTAVMRIYHEQKPELKPVAAATGIHFAWGLGLLLITLPLIFSGPVSTFIIGTEGYALHVCLALLTFVVDIAGHSASTILVIRQRSILFSVLGLVRLFVGLGLNIWLIIFLGYGVVGVFISSLLTAVVACVLFHVIAIRDHGFGFNKKIAIDIAAFQFPQLPGEIVAFLGRQAERFLVRGIISLNGVGILEMAYKFPPLLNMLITIPFGRAWRTKSIEIADEEWAPSAMGVMFSRYLYFMVFAGLMMAITIPQIITMLTPPDFWLSGRIARIEVLTTIFGGCVSFLYFGIIYSKKTKYMSNIRLVLTPIKVGIAFYLISSFGLKGAAYSAMIIQFAELILVTYYSQKLYPIQFEKFEVSLIIISAIIVFIALGYNEYESFGPAIYVRENLLPGFIEFIGGTFLGDWKSGKLIALLEQNKHPFVVFAFNTLFGLSYLLIWPFVSQKDKQNI